MERLERTASHTSYVGGASFAKDNVEDVWWVYWNHDLRRCEMLSISTKAGSIQAIARSIAWHCPLSSQTVGLGETFARTWSSPAPRHRPKFPATRAGRHQSPQDWGLRNLLKDEALGLRMGDSMVVGRLAAPLRPVTAAFAVAVSVDVRA